MCSYTGSVVVVYVHNTYQNLTETLFLSN